MDIETPDSADHTKRAPDSDNGASPNTGFAAIEGSRSDNISALDSRAIHSDSENEPFSIPIPIERERKRYSAAPGQGKQYKDQHSQSVAPETSMNYDNNEDDSFEDLGNRPHLCYYPECDRSRAGHGFPRRYNTFDHMKRVHGWIPEEPNPSSSSSSHAEKRKTRPVEEASKPKRQYRAVYSPPPRASPFLD
jgi:hypothetical protein